MSPRKERNSMNSPFSSSKFSVLIPSFLKRKKDNDENVSDTPDYNNNNNDDTSSVGSFNSIGNVNDLK